MNKTPAVRFKGFTKDWEQRKLGDITVSYSGGTPTAGNTEYYGGAIPFIRSGEISKKQTETSEIQRYYIGLANTMFSLSENIVFKW